MEDLQELLERDVAGRPVWQWVVIVVVGVALGIAVQRRLAPKGDPAVDPTAAADGRNPITGLAYGEHIGGLTLGQDYAAPPPAPAPGPSTETPDRTNRDWLRDAHDELRGRWAPSVIDTALLRFMNGQPLTEEQVRVVDAALLALGPPPDGNPPIERAAADTSRDAGETSPQPKPQPPSSGGGGSGADAALREQIRSIFDKYGLSVTSSRLDRLVREVNEGRTLADIDAALRPFAKTGTGGTSSRTHTVVAGDTYWDLAGRYYGDNSQWRRIADANPYAARDIPIGVTLTIP